MRQLQRNNRRARSSSEMPEMWQHKIRAGFRRARHLVFFRPASVHDVRLAGENPRSGSLLSNTLLITGFDILFFWLARMIMFGCHFMQGHEQDSLIKKATAEAEHETGAQSDDSVPFRHRSEE